jgi:hypothetical protein
MNNWSKGFVHAVRELNQSLEYFVDATDSVRRDIGSFGAGGH